MTKQVTITFLSDPVCPYCFLGKRKLEAAMAQFPDVQFNIDYRPYQLNSKATRADKRPYLETLFGGKQRASMLFDRMGQMGKQWNINFTQDGIVNNTFNSHRLLAFAKQFGIHNQLKEEILSAYHEQGLDIGDFDVLSSLFVKAGGDQQKAKAFLESDELVQETRLAIDTYPRQERVQGVPYFKINDTRVEGAVDPSEFVSAIKKNL
jgi:predicted DsbA family dithiol-disulfide isomerase